MKTWLKGGLIGTAIGILLSLIPPLTIISLMIIGATFGWGPENQGYMIIISYLIYIIPFFIIGAIIGRIKGK